jgi:predicted nucleotidyltransferase
MLAISGESEIGQPFMMMRRQSTRLPPGPRPSVPDPRDRLLEAVLAFVRAARSLPGVHRIALVGSLATDKPVPKDADVLVTIDAAMDLARLAVVGRRLKGAGQKINLGADVFLADTASSYIGRICHYRECHRRVLCRARHCGQRQHLNDDLHVVTLGPELIASPPVELWPHVVRRIAVPADTEALLVTELEKEGSRDGLDVPA